MSKGLDIAIKALLGKKVTEEEVQYINTRASKYELVRQLYIDRANRERSTGLTNFHFTPGESFDETPVEDIVNSLFNLPVGKPLDFGDLRWRWEESNPPVTGKEQTNLADI
jgi:hypothetical protein